MNHHKNGLKNIRNKANLSKSELALSLNVEENIVNIWESGYGTYTLEEIKKIMNLLNTTSEMILFNENRKGIDISCLSQEQLNLIINLYLMMKKQKG